MSDLQLSAQDEVLLESLVLAASDNVTRAPAPDRDQYAPERRRAFVETSGAGNVYLGTGDAWVDVSENTGLLSSLFQGGDVNANSVNTDSASVTNQLDAGSVNTDSLYNTDNPITFRVRKDSNGNYIAHGRSGEVATDTDILELLNTLDNNHLPSQGGHIHLQAGILKTEQTYSDGPGVEFNNPVYLSGEGRATQIKNINNATDSNEGASLLRFRGRSIVENLYINGNQENQSTGGIDPSKDGFNIQFRANDSIARSVWSWDSTGDGIEVVLSDRSIVANCSFNNNWEHNIHLSGSNGVVVDGNVCKDEVNKGQIYTHSPGGQSVEYVTISNNVVINGDTYGIDLRSGAGTLRYAVVEGNVVFNTTDAGVVLYHTGNEDNLPEHISIKDNMLIDCGQRTGGGEGAIIVETGNYGTIEGNHIVGSHNHHIFSDLQNAINDWRIEDNELYNPGTNPDVTNPDGINWTSGGNNMTNVLVNGNHIVKDDAGASMRNAIRVDGAGTFTDIHAAENFLKGGSGDAIFGYANFSTVERNQGFVTENSGTAAVSDGDTIAHGLDVTPTYVDLTPTQDNRTVGTASVDATNITVRLRDNTGSGIGTDEDVYWRALAR